jgi:hypothetical protein
LILYSKWYFWWGGETYGPRLVADITPFLCLYLYPVWEAVDQKRLLKIAFVSLGIISLLMHAIGAFGFDPSWYKKSDVTVESDRLWSFRDSPFLYYGKRLLLKNISFVRTAVSSLSTSAQTPHDLSASLAYPEIPSRHSATMPLRVSIAVTNTGPAIWLFQTNNGRYGVRLGWRWLTAGGEVTYSEGWNRLVRDVFPGEREEFNVDIWPPSTEGQYILELGMINESATWFGARRFPVHIVGSCSFEDILAKDPKPVHDGPTITIMPDRPTYLRGGNGRIYVSIANGNVARNLKHIALIRYPDGHLRSLSSSADILPDLPCSQWIPMAAPLIFSRGFKADWYLGLRLRNMPDGLYTLYAFIIEPGGVEIIAKSSSTFYLSATPLEDDKDNMARMSGK